MLHRFPYRALIASAAAFILLLPLNPARAAEPYEINAIVSLTGTFAFLGTAEAESIRLIEGIVNKQGGINGQPVHMVIQDDQSNPSVAVQLANGVIAKNPAIMLGPTYVASCLAVAPLVKANGPVQYCFAPTIHPPAGSYTFSGGASSADQAYESLVFMQAKRWKRIAIIATTDATGNDIVARFTDAFNSGKFPGLTLIDTEHFAPTDVSVAAQYAKIAALKPDAIIVATVGSSTGTALRGLQDAGLSDVPIMSNLGNVIHVQINQYVNILPKNIYFTAPRFIAHDVSGKGPVRDAQDQFYKAYAAQGITPDVGNNFSWDPTWILIDALRHLGTKATAKQVLDYVEALHGYAGTDGIYDYRGGDQRGLGLSSLVICTWDHAKKTWVTVSQPGGKPLPS
jgi:branched-chain amino acid transport system substrate-binding protein